MVRPGRAPGAVQTRLDAAEPTFKLHDLFQAGASRNGGPRRCPNASANSGGAPPEGEPDPRAHRDAAPAAI